VSQWQCPNVEEEGDTMAGDELGMGESYVLNEIECAEGPISAAEIAGNLNPTVTVSIVTRELVRLRDRGLVEQVGDPAPGPNPNAILWRAR
jgi:DNA-binding MarR family transcriptional regulator